MKIIIIQNRIVNLHNVTIVSRFLPGDRVPGHHSFTPQFRRYVIFFEFVAAIGESDIYENPSARFVYDGRREWMSDWAEIVDAMNRRPALADHDYAY